MKTFELTKEQRDMIANCILEQMHNWRKTLDIITSSAEMRTLVENEIGKLKTLLDYINS